MRYAGFWKRLGAALGDTLVLLPIGVSFIWVRSQSKEAAMAALPLATFASLFYTMAFHAVCGQTPGKMMAGIKVVNLSGAPIGWRQAFFRSSFDIGFSIASLALQMGALAGVTPAAFNAWKWTEFDSRITELAPAAMILGWIATAWIWSEFVVLLCNEKKRALHDFIAGTVVVRLDRPQPAPTAAGVADLAG